MNDAMTFSQPRIEHRVFTSRQNQRGVGWYIGLGLTFFVGTMALIAIIAISMYWREMYLPQHSSGSVKEVTISEGATLHSIAAQLAKQGFIRHPFFFEIYMRLSGGISKIQAGKFSIPTHISGHDLASLLRVAEVDQISLRFLEGWRSEEMADYLTSKNIAGLSGNDLLSAEMHPSPKIRQLLGSVLPSNASLEGFLFPDTYLIERGTTTEQLVEKMVTTYKSKVTQTMKTGFQTQGLSEYEAVTLASIVEREGRSADDRAVIAGILLKRLQNNIALYVDATLQYGLGYSQSEERWWRQNLTVDELAFDTPFNSRIHAGLPPQPICNPSLQALEAVAHPKTTPYLYYMHDNQGIPHYAATLAQHNANVATYLQ